MTAHRVAFASAVLGGSRLAAKFADLLAALIVARMLAPADFGLVAIAISTLTLVQSFTDLPIANALVHHGRMERAEFDTAFTLNLLRGALIALALIGLSVPFAVLFQDARITEMMWVLAIAPLATGLASPRLATFAKAVNYTPNALVQITGKLSGFALSVVLVWSTHSYWALIIGLATSAVVTAIGSHVVAPYRPRVSLACSRALLDFAGWSSLATIAVTLYGQGDRFFVGGALGKVPLGYYVIGTTLATTVTWAFASMTIPSLFSGFTKIRDDRGRLRAAYLKSQQMMMALMVPIGFGIAALAQPLIQISLGYKWAPAVPIVEILAPVSALQMMVVPVESLAMALGQNKSIFFRNLISLAIAVPAIVGGALAFGVLGAAVARAATALVGVCLNLMIAKRLLAVSVSQQVMNSWRSIASALVMTLAVRTVVALEPVQGMGIAAWMEFCGYVLLAAAVYYATHLSLWCVVGRPQGAEGFAIDIITRLSRGAGIRKAAVVGGTDAS